MRLHIFITPVTTNETVLMHAFRDVMDQGPLHHRIFSGPIEVTNMYNVCLTNV